MLAVTEGDHQKNQEKILADIEGVVHELKEGRNSDSHESLFCKPFSISVHHSVLAARSGKENIGLMM